VPPQPAGALEDEVDGGEIGHHHVEVKVETLFRDLRRD
jgi:hypothetical protein